ncbi:metal-sensitive transcriptional regulator, partial [Brevibacterium litoralis]
EDCRAVVQQLSAVSKAVDRAGFLVISTALQDCLADPDADGGPKPAELEKLFMSLA